MSSESSKTLIAQADQEGLHQMVVELLQACALLPEEEQTHAWWVFKQQLGVGERVMELPQEDETACWVEYDPQLHDESTRHLNPADIVWEACKQLITKLTTMLWNTLCVSNGEEAFVDHPEYLNDAWNDVMSTWMDASLPGAIEQIMADARIGRDPREAWDFYREFLELAADHVEVNFEFAIDGVEAPVAT